MQYRIDDNPGAAMLGREPALARVEADTPLGALDAYADEQGIARYSSNLDEGYVYELDDGRLGAVCSNYEIVATPTDPSSSSPYAAWRERLEGEVAEHRERGKVPAGVPADELEWQALYAREPRSVYAAWVVLTGRPASTAARAASSPMREVRADDTTGPYPTGARPGSSDYVRHEAIAAASSDELRAEVRAGGPAAAVDAMLAELARRGVCADCGREHEGHESGLCDSCEMQRSYDRTSSPPPELTAEQVAAVQALIGWALDEDHAAGGGWLESRTGHDGIVQALEQVARALDTEREVQQ